MDYLLKLESEEISLILNALTYDIQVRHGNGGGENLVSLINKIKSETKAVA